MHLFELAFFTAGTLYALFREQALLFYFVVVVGIYLVIGKVLPGARDLSIRKKIMAGTWKPPSEGIIYARHPVQLDKVMELIENLPKQSRLTPTHFVIKVIGELLNNNPSLNGKYVFGKFVNYYKADVSCVVDIDGGKDLAIVLVQDVQNKSVQEISQFIKEKAQDIKSNKGDDEHKKRMGMIKYIPAFFVSVLLPISKFIFHFLGISIKPLSVKQNQFGGAVLTSIGMIGFENATAPIIGVIGCSLCITLNAVCDKPVVQNGQIVTRKVANINFAIDHRYVDTVECQNFLSSFVKVFEEPEKYLRKEDKGRETQEKSQKTYILKLRTSQQITESQTFNNSAKLIPHTSS